MPRGLRRPCFTLSHSYNKLKILIDFPLTYPVVSMQKLNTGGPEHDEWTLGFQPMACMYMGISLERRNLVPLATSRTETCPTVGAPAGVNAPQSFRETETDGWWRMCGAHRCWLRITETVTEHHEGRLESFVRVTWFGIQRDLNLVESVGFFRRNGCSAFGPDC